MIRWHNKDINNNNYKKQSMSIFDFFIPFWQESEKEPFTTTEVALYHYLLSQANRNHWVMPIRCSTTIICHCLSTTRQNLHKAREGLKARGLIGFNRGIDKRKPAEYTILQLSDQLTHQLRVQLPHNKIVDRYNNNNYKQSRNDKAASSRRSVDVPTASEQNYDGAF